MSESSERKLTDMIIRAESPELDAAEARSKEVMRGLENVIEPLFSELRNEVQTMHVAKRFKRDKKPSESPHAYTSARRVNALLKDANEAEFKREQLLSDIESIKQDMLRNVSRLGAAIMEIEATKTEDAEGSAE